MRSYYSLLVDCNGEGIMRGCYIKLFCFARKTLLFRFKIVRLFNFLMTNSNDIVMVYKKMMKTMLVCLLIYGSCAGKESGSQGLSKSDSVKAEQYVHKAFAQPLYSVAHQCYLDSALMIAPTNAYYWQQKAMPLYKQQKYQVGLRFLDSAVKYDAQHYIDYRAFMKCIFQKDYIGAIQDFKQATAVNGNIGLMDHSYQFYTALCHLQLNQFDSSESELQTVIKEETERRGPNWVHYLHWFYLGVVQFETGRYDKAIESLEQSLKAYKNFPDARYYKAVCLIKLGKKKKRSRTSCWLRRMRTRDMR